MKISNFDIQAAKDAVYVLELFKEDHRNIRNFLVRAWQAHYEFTNVRKIVDTRGKFFVRRWWEDGKRHAAPVLALGLASSMPYEQSNPFIARFFVGVLDLRTGDQYAIERTELSPYDKTDTIHNQAITAINGLVWKESEQFWLSASQRRRIGIVLRIVVET